jgi:hypothetical protein
MTDFNRLKKNNENKINLAFDKKRQILPVCRGHQSSFVSSSKK